MKAPLHATCCVVALLPVVALGYINGGDHRNDLLNQKTAIEKDGSKAAFAGAFPGETKLGLVFIPPPDPPENFQRFVKQLVTRAIAELPKDQADQFTAEHRDQLVKHATEWLATAKKKNPKDSITKDIGPFTCKIGAGEISTWWETNYKSEGPKIHARKTYDLFYIAIRLRQPAEEASKTPESKSPW